MATGAQATANQRALNIKTKTQVDRIIAATGAIDTSFEDMPYCIICWCAID